MLKDLAEPHRVVTLIPNTGIQFLDFGFNEADIQNVARNFWEEVSRSEVDETGKPKRTLYPLEQDQEGRLVYLSDADEPARMAPEDETYGVRAQRALDIFDGEWLPLPYLRQKERSSTGRHIYDEGPTNWARIRVAKLETPDKQGNTHRVTVAIDTMLLERRANAPYAAPEPSDALEDVQFRLVTDNLDNRFYLALNWVRDWLRERYLASLTGLQGRSVRSEDLQYPTEYWANYIMLLEGISAGCQIPAIQFADTLSALKGKPVEVNLVLDIGNSRTCGILIEQPARKRFVEISQAYRLELRDLTHTERTYDYPFESRVEFAPASFGSSEHSRKSGRPKRDAFWWPSPVRVGPEASWLSAQSDGTEGITGISSPKRYLWDKDAQPQPWANNRGTLPHDQAIPSIKGPMTARLTEAGDLIRAGDGAMVGLLPRYSRSSLYTLMLSELLIHAITQINSVAIRYQRADRDLPRILKRIILTLPSATPVAEQKILRRRAQAAIDLVWQVMDWQDDDPVHPKPAIKLDWDEATCTHLVYLYNEINRKYRGLPRDFFSLMRKKRNGDENLSLRIASMDMGGGTTDLMIMQHEIEGQAIIHPRQLFREGFRQAGDDILKVVVEDCVLPSVRRALEDSGVSSSERIISDLFSGDVEGMGQQQRVKRSLFVNQVMVPIALGLLGHYENVDQRRSVPPRHFKMEELLGNELMPSQAILDYLEEVAKRDGGEGFSLKAINFTMDADQMAGAVLASGAKGVIEDLCDVVRSYDCDLLLLSGRPSRLPAIHDLIISNLAVTPNRVVPMDTYEVGNWYPFRGSDFSIQDPKTTVVVGAMLCHICEGLQEGFNMRASEIRMRSTARYIGIMSINEQILDENVLLENVDFDTGQGLVQFDVSMEKPFFIGYRQLPMERWKTTPLYYVEFRNPERVSKLKLPLTVTFERATPRNEDDEEVMEDFRISDAMDAERAPCRNEVQVRLQTMRVNRQSDGGYWLDTGILRTGGRH